MKILLTSTFAAFAMIASASAHCGSCDTKSGKKECTEGKCDKVAKADCDKSACDKDALANTRVFVVKGMSCGSCSNGLTKTLTAVEGVSGVKVCHKSGHASFVADSEKVSTEALLSTIAKTGLAVTGERVQVSIKGSSCESGCSKMATNKLAAIEGVSAVESLCSKSGHAVVIIDPAKTNKADLVAKMAATEAAAG